MTETGTAARRGGARAGAGRKRAAVKKECHTVASAPDEREKIRQLAAAAGKSVSRFLVEAALKDHDAEEKPAR